MRSKGLSRLLCGDDVHGRKILACEAIILFSRFVEEHAITIVTCFVPQIRRAVFRCSVLRPA